jgi:hypothetical protein
MMAGGVSESEVSAINKPIGGWSPARPMDWGSRFVLIVTLLAGLFMTAAGVAALLALAWRDGLALVLAGFLVANTTPMPLTTLSTLTWAATAATAGGWPPCRC